MTFEFVAGRPALDFVATVAERGTNDIELLPTPAELARWVRAAGLIDRAPRVRRDEWVAARRLREAMYRLVRSLGGGPPARPADRLLVNAAARRSRPRARLTPSGDVRRVGDLDAALAVLATDCIELFAGPDRDALRWCAAPRCTRPFIDRSRAGGRRWCGMRGCGDRAKAAAYRRRHGAATRPG